MIAREWKYLEPVRAFCEIHGIEVQMGNEEMPGFWHLRETLALVEWLRGRETRLVDHGELRGWLNARPASGPWIELLREALDEHALEAGEGVEESVDNFIEWLAEWGREVRRRPRGLTLLSAHRAKGLEFDHVAVLDGGWDKDNGEDPDAPRKLYYVAMTRARKTLALVRFQGAQPQQRSSPPNFAREPAPPVYSRVTPLPFAFPNNGSVLHRPSGLLPPKVPELARRYRRPRPDVGFAGRRGDSHPVHDAIAALSPGDPLEVRMDEQGRWNLLDESGTAVGRLAKGFDPPPGTRCGSACVLAVIGRTREASEPEYRDYAQCDSWEVVVPELVFEPVRE